jgi:mono/diheme cytochrome c family protein
MRTRSPILICAVIVVFLAALALARGSSITWPIYPAAGASPIFPQAVGTSNRGFERTPFRLKRGEYVANNVITCFRCHSERDWNSPGAPLVSGKKGAGNFFVTGAGPVDPRKPAPKVFAANITPDPETGVGRWSDEALARAIRESVAPDGRSFPTKFHVGCRNLSDEDLSSVVVYLRTIPPVRNSAPKSTMSSSQQAQTTKPIPPITVPEPRLDNPVRRGEYLVSISDCASCHTTDIESAPLHDKKFSGGRLMSDDPEHYVVTPNITMDPSGISYYDEAMFVRIMRTGKVRARKLYAIMPWGYFRKMNDDDLKAIFAFLKTQARVQHIVDNTEPPTYCRRCLQRHGGGDRN